MALGLDQVLVLPAIPALAAETPGRKGDAAEAPLLDRFTGHSDGLRIAMVEVDPEEEAPFLGFRQQNIRLLQFEHEGLLNEQRIPGPDDLQRGFEMPLVRQAETHQVGTLRVQHLLNVRVVPHPERLGAGLCLLKCPAGDCAEVHVLTSGQNPCMLHPPAAGADQRDLDPRFAHCSTTTFPVSC